MYTVKLAYQVGFINTTLHYSLRPCLCDVPNSKNWDVARYAAFMTRAVSALYLNLA